MRLLRLFKLLFVGIFLLALSAAAFAAGTFEEAAKSLSDKIGEATAVNRATPPTYGIFEHIKVENFGVVSTAVRGYLSRDGAKFGVQLVRTQTDADAYALLTAVRQTAALAIKPLSGVGTAGFISQGRLGFFKGPVFVTVDSSATVDEATRVAFARALAATLDNGSGEIPALATHLPNWEATQARALYAVSSSGLQAAVPDQPTLDAVSFDGGTEAVTAKYDQGQLVIVEFQTPQLAADNDARIGQRIAELRGQNQPVPSAYRRVGNYAVLVFAAPSAQAANSLIDQVKYEKVVQWLGEDPHRFERANRFWLNMSGSIILNTIKATALAILICLGIGGIFGSIIFARRRAQAALTEQYSDAGGMMRLNLDDLATQPARLLPPGSDD